MARVWKDEEEFARESWSSGKSGNLEGACLRVWHCDRSWLVGPQSRVPVRVCRIGGRCGGAGLGVVERI